MQPLGAEDPRKLGEYQLLRRLGAGGMGRVYLGRSPGGRTVAVKVVHAHFAADEQFRARFRLEIEAGRRVGVEWAAPVLDADPEAETPWVATGFVAGPSLQQAVDAHGALPERSVRALGTGLAEALTAVHRRGLVHRDVKPSNVLLTLDGPRLIDFGIARVMDATASLTATGVSVGSPGFMSPEQVLGREVDRPSDVFSVGAVLAFAASGQAPFPGHSSAALLYKVVYEEPELHGISGELRELITVALAKEAADRPTSEELADQLGGSASAAELITPGWLPTPVVEGVSRRAVELLELEVEPLTRSPESPTPPRSPVTEEGRTAPIGAFGPPLSPFGPSATPPPHVTSAPPRRGTPPSVRTAPPSGVRRGAPPPYALRTPPPKDGSAWRGLRLALGVVAGVVVAGVGVTALLAGGLLLALDDQSPGTDGARSGEGKGSEGAGGQSQSGTELDRVPKRFVGTWRGTVRSGANEVELTVTVDPGSRGQRLIRTVHAMSDVRCAGVARVDRITKSKLTLTEYADGDSPERLGVPLCSQETSKTELSLSEDVMTYESHDQVAGRPTGDLKREKD